MLFVLLLCWVECGSVSSVVATEYLDDGSTGGGVC